MRVAAAHLQRGDVIRIGRRAVRTVRTVNPGYGNGETLISLLYWENPITRIALRSGVHRWATHHVRTRSDFLFDVNRDS